MLLSLAGWIAGWVEGPGLAARSKENLLREITESGGRLHSDQLSLADESLAQQCADQGLLRFEAGGWSSPDWFNLTDAGRVLASTSEERWGGELRQESTPQSGAGISTAYSVFGIIAFCACLIALAMLDYSPPESVQIWLLDNDIKFVR